MTEKKKTKKKTQKQQIPWYARPFASYIKKVELPNGDSKITYSLSNVKINHFLIPVYFLIEAVVLNKLYRVPMVAHSKFESGALYLSFLSCFFYYWTSMFFQPDLDMSVNRPGMNTFPLNLNKRLRRLPILNILHVLLTPVRVFWYLMWEPIAVLFTHRGAVHWPIIGVWIRIIWIYLLYKATTIAMPLLGFHPGYISAVIEYWVMAFFPWNQEFGGKIFFMFCFPVYISDIFHSLFDFLENRSKGMPFCSQMHRRGLLINIVHGIKDKPKEIYGHIKKFGGY